MVRGGHANQCSPHLPAAGIDDIKTGLTHYLPPHFAVEDIRGVLPAKIDSLRQDQTQFSADASTNIRNIEDETLKRRGPIGKD
jgi:hypothetical protein